MYEAFEYTQAKGIVLESEYERSYQARAGECKDRSLYSHFKNEGQGEKENLTNE